MTAFTQAVRDALQKAADPERAHGMSAYMKHQFQYFGVATPKRRELIRPLLAELKGSTPAQLLKLANELWELPEREYQYVAIDLLGTYRRRFEPRHIAALLRLAQKKSWWDTVDGLASVVGPVVREHQAQPLMDAAIEHRNLWVRRIAIIHQLGSRADTDTKRLFAYAAARAAETDFFIRKAIGWALREYAKHDPAAVYRFVDRMGDRLSPLTRREATKHRAS